jgi:mRNA interferase YafQ
MQYYVRSSKQFKKDLRKLQRSGVNITKLKKVVYALEKGKKLDSKHKDHPLKGSLKGKRECHIASGWLLLYEKDEEELLLLLLRTGDHRHVLNIE